MKKTALFTALLCLAQSTLHADVPLFINYQGKVADSTGLPIGASGTAAAPTAAPVNRKVIFRIYDASTGGNRLWTEEQTATISLGVFSVLLGNGINPTGTASTESRPALDTIFTPSAATSRFLEIMVDNGDNAITASDVPVSPRQQITSTAFAFHAKVADGIASASDLTINPLTGTASNNGLGWYGTGRTFNSVAVDGPVLYGNSGGALGSNASGTQKLALAWNAAGQVGVGATSSYDTNNKLTLQGDDSVTPARQLVIRGNTETTERLNIGFDTTANQATLQSYTAVSTAGNLLLNPSGGNVGIGSTTPPAAKLSIGAPIYGDANTLSSSFVTNAGTLGQTSGSELLLGNFGFGSNNSQSLAISGYRTAAGATWADTAVVLGMNVDVAKRSGAFLSLHSTGNVGIGTLTPGFPLNMSNAMGDKIALWGNSGNSTGFGIQTNLLQIHTDTSAGDIGFGYGSSAAMTETMRIKGNGNVGIGTASPAYKLDVNGTARVSGQLNLSNAIVMAKDQTLYGTSSSNGVEPAFWPRSGSGNGTYLNYGSGGLFIRNNASAQEMYLNGGRLAVGTTDTSFGTLTVDGPITSIGSTTNSIAAIGSYGGVQGYVKMSYESGITYFDVRNTTQHGDTIRGFSYDGDNNLDWRSDRRLKQDIVDAEPMLARLMQLPFRRYHYKDAPDVRPEFGVIAQEVESLFPDLVATGEDGMKTVGYTSFATIACKALQEYKTRTDADLGKLNEQIHERDTKIEALEAKLAEQEKRATAQADEVTSQNARLVALEKLMSKAGDPETVSIKLGDP
jgi:hypothetical protein